MSDDRPSLAISLAKASLRAAFAVAWGGALIWFAGDTDPTDRGGNEGHFSLLLTGMILIAIGVVGFIYAVMKSRAPTLRRHRPTEAGEIIFDPEAAVQRYLAEKNANERDAAPPSPASVTRPVFGRRAEAPTPTD